MEFETIETNALEHHAFPVLGLVAMICLFLWLMGVMPTISCSALSLSTFSASVSSLPALTFRVLSFSVSFLPPWSLPVWFLPIVSPPSASSCLPGAWPQSMRPYEDLDGPWDPTTKLRKLASCIERLRLEVVTRQYWEHHWFKMYSELAKRDRAMADWIRQATKGQFSGADTEEVPDFDESWLALPGKTSSPYPPPPPPPRLSLQTADEDAATRHAARNQVLEHEVFAAKNEAAALRQQLETSNLANQEARQRLDHQDTLVEQLRTENERLRHELQAAQIQKQPVGAESTDGHVAEIQHLQSQLQWMDQEGTRIVQGLRADIAGKDQQIRMHAAEASQYQAKVLETVHVYETKISALRLTEAHLREQIHALEVAPPPPPPSTSTPVPVAPAPPSAQTIADAVSKATKRLEHQLAASSSARAQDKQAAETRLEHAHAQLNEYANQLAARDATEIRPLKLQIEQLEKAAVAVDESLAKATRDKEMALKGFEIKNGQLKTLREENNRLQARLVEAGLKKD